MNTATFTTAELVALYNALTGKSIKKFSTRAAGERQVAAAQAAADAERDAAAPASMEDEAADAADDVRAAEWEVEAAAAKAAAAASADWSHTCPGCGATQDITPAGLEGTTAEARQFCHSCATEWFPDTGKVYTAPKASPARAASIAASWTRPDVAAARAARSSVTVTSPTHPVALAYSSLGAAFRALSLPMGQHIKFRGQLKAAGTLAFKDFVFVNHAL